MTYKNNSQLLTTPSREKGMAVLSMVILLLVVVGMLSMTATKSTILETKMVFNVQDKQRSLMAADSSALFAWEQAKPDLDDSLKDIVNNDTHAGYYVLGDKIVSSDKKLAEWNAIKNVTAWPWDDTDKRFALPQQLGGATNPMKLQANPQYAIGIHNPITRKGTAGYKCIPVSMIGASKGGTATTRTLIEMRAIPKSACFFDKIK